MHLVRIGAIVGFERLVQSLGYNPVQLIKKAGLSPAVFRDHTTYVSHSKVAELLELAAIHCNDPFFGFRIALGHGIVIFDEIVASMCQEASISDAIAFMNRHLYLHASGIQIEQSRKAGEVLISTTFDFDSELGTDQLTQFSVGRMFSLMEILTNSDPYHFPICLKQPAPETDQFPDHLSQVSFSSSFNGMKVPVRVMDRKPSPDQRLIQKQLDSRLGHLQQLYPNNFEAQVREVIGKLLPTGECSLDRVAAGLNLHPRNLQRMLKNENSCYGSLVKNVRQTIAERHLATGKVSITDLALNLGYAELAVFSRNFKKWTGQSPLHWRAKRLGEPVSTASTDKR